MGKRNKERDFFKDNCELIKIRKSKLCHCDAVSHSFLL